jgi:hypothetical protein
VSARSDADRAPSARSRAKDDTRQRARPPIDRWSPSTALETPKDPAYAFRWVAEYVNGVQNVRAVHMKIREGYERVRITELPEDFLLFEEDERGDGFCRYGGLILMRLPIELYWQRQSYFLSRSAEALRSANELQGVAGRDAVEEDRGTRTLMGEDSARALRAMMQPSGREPA